MYLLGKEHNPPHIHILYGEYNAVIDLQTLKLMEGDLPGKGLAMAMEWTTQGAERSLLCSTISSP